MADRTESTIVIPAPPHEVIDVISDFDNYPEWAEVKSATILSENEGGWAEQVEFHLESGVIRDTYVLGYDWQILESGEGHAAVSLLRNGSGRLQAFFYGLLPQNAAELTSYTVYRWECAIRSSVVLGFVGAGGLGQQMDNSMKMFAGGEVATMLLVFVALVALADRVSAWLRRQLG